jgi:hypothetical protein
MDVGRYLWRALSNHSESGSAQCAPCACTTAGIRPPHFQIPQPLLSMSSYWNSFPDFGHNPTTPVMDEFQRLAKLKGWIGKDQRKNYRKQWGKHFQSEFGKYYGRDASLCREVGLDAIPESVTKCKHAIYFPCRF